MLSLAAEGHYSVSYYRLAQEERLLSRPVGAFTPGQPSPRRHVNRALFNPQFVDVSTDANQAHGSQQIAFDQAAT